MNAEATSTAGSSLDAIQAQITALEARVAELEAEVEHEHEDIEKLKSVTAKDHERLKSMKVSGNVPPPTQRVAIGL